MTQFKIGDRVRIRKDLKAGLKDEYCINNYMASLSGEIHEITGSAQSGYHWRIAGWSWLESWLEPVSVAITTTEKIAELRDTMTANEKAYVAEREANLKALNELLALPPSVGDIYWNGKVLTTRCTVMAVNGDKLWYDNSTNQGFVKPLGYFKSIGYERYVP
jgi:hypothetical protein